MNSNLIAKSFRSMMYMMIFAGIVAMCGSVIDGVVVGNCLGADNMTAFGYAAPVFMIIASVGGIFSSGGKAECAVMTGEGRYDEARENFTRAIVLTIISGIIMMAALLSAAEPIAAFLGASGDYIELTAGYIRGLGIGVIPIMLLQVVTVYYSLDGAEILGFVCAVVMSAVNITLDLIVGLVLHGSLFGIGLATSVSYLLALMSLGLYFRKKDRLFRFVSVKNSAAKTLSMIYTGLPSAVNRVCFCSTSVILNHMLTAAAGEMAVAAFSVQNTVGTFADAVLIGVTSTIAVFSGMFYGERDKTALRASFKVAFRYGMILACGMGLIIFIFAPAISAGMLSADAATLECTVVSLRFYAVALPGDIFSLLLMYHYLSTRKVMLSNAVCVFYSFATWVLSALVLGNLFGLNGIWLGKFAAGILFFAATMPFLHKYRGGGILDYVMATEKDFEPDNRKVCQISVADNMEDVAGACDKLRKFCAESGFERNKVFRICLALEELAGNIVQHGYKDSRKNHFIDIRLVLNDDNSGCLSVRDNGRKFNPLEYKYSDSQYGIRIIRGITDRIDYHYVASMNCLNMYIK